MAFDTCKWQNNNNNNNKSHTEILVTWLVQDLQITLILIKKIVVTIATLSFCSHILQMNSHLDPLKNKKKDLLFFFFFLQCSNIYAISCLRSQRLNINVQIPLLLLSKLCEACAGQGLQPMDDETYTEGTEGGIWCPCYRQNENSTVSFGQSKKK